MFNRLRNRFMLLNLVIISVLMLIAFAAIYIITYRNVQADIDMEMRRIADFHAKAGPRDRGPLGDHVFEGGAPHPFPEPDDRDGGPLQDRSVSFAIETDADWTKSSVSSIFTMDESFYDEALDAAVAEARSGGPIRLDNVDWAYEKHVTPSGHRIVFLDVTSRQAILTNLVYTFLIVGLLMLVVISFISRFFANRSIAPVKEAFEKQRQFIADASHELKTPLAVINTNADALLVSGDETVRSQARWVRYIQAETERMAKLTGDLLYLTQMEEAREAMMASPFSASDAVESVILTMEAVIFERELALDYDIEPGLVVQGNAEQFKQVVMILLDNAVKYSYPRSSIRVTLKRQHHDMVLAVTNSGEGIAPKHLPRIFDRFYRTDPSRSRKQGGYGLGLAIARAITEQHKGRIGVKSVVNERTTFTVQIPLAS